MDRSVRYISRFEGDAYAKSKMITEFNALEDCLVIDLLRQMHLSHQFFVVLINEKRALQTDLVRRSDLVIILPMIKGGF